MTVFLEGSHWSVLYYRINLTEKMLPVKLEIPLENINYRNHHIYVTISTFVSDTSLFHIHCKIPGEFP